MHIWFSSDVGRKWVLVKLIRALLWRPAEVASDLPEAGATSSSGRNPLGTCSAVITTALKGTHYWATPLKGDWPPVTVPNGES